MAAARADEYRPLHAEIVAAAALADAERARALRRHREQLRRIRRRDFFPPPEREAVPPRSTDSRPAAPARGIRPARAHSASRVGAAVKWVTRPGGAHRPRRLRLADPPFHRPGRASSCSSPTPPRCRGRDARSTCRGVELSHHGGDCTFETLLRRYELTDPVLWRIAALVHEADIDDGRYDAPEAAGFDLALRGLSMVEQRRPGPRADRTRSSTGVYEFFRRELLLGREPGMTITQRSPQRQPRPAARRAGLAEAEDVVPFREAARAWFAISLQTFGGPAGQIAVMQRTLVDEKRWIGQQPVPARPDLLHAAARPGGPAAGDLHRLAAQRHPRRPGRRRPVRAARRGGPAGAVRDLRRVPATRTVVDRAVRRPGPGGARHRRPGRRPRRRPGAGGTRPGRAGRGRVPRAGRRSRCRSRSSSRAAAAVGWALGRWAPRTMQRPAQPARPTTGPPPLIPDDALHTERPSRGARASRSWPSGCSPGRVPVGARGGRCTGTDSIFTEQGAVLLRRRAGHLRRRLRRAGLRRAAGGGGLRLARPRRDGHAVSPWPRPPPAR